MRGICGVCGEPVTFILDRGPRWHWVHDSANPKPGFQRHTVVPIEEAIAY